MTEQREVYEYAGFSYYVERPTAYKIRMVPVAGQHPAAAKEKHRAAALDCYIFDQREARRRLADAVPLKTTGGKA